MACFLKVIIPHIKLTKKKFICNTQILKRITLFTLFRCIALFYEQVQSSLISQYWKSIVDARI